MKRILFLPLLLVAAPAAAEEAFDLNEAFAMAGAVDAVTDAVLAVPIDGILRAVDPRAARSAPRTVGELMARGDPNFRDNLRQDMLRAGKMAVGAARAAGELQSAADDFARRVEAAVARADY